MIVAIAVKQVDQTLLMNAFAAGYFLLGGAKISCHKACDVIFLQGRKGGIQFQDLPCLLLSGQLFIIQGQQRQKNVYIYVGGNCLSRFG